MKKIDLNLPAQAAGKLPGFNVPRINPPAQRPGPVVTYSPEHRKAFYEMIGPQVQPERTTAQALKASMFSPGQLIPNAAGIGPDVERIPAGYSDPANPAEAWEQIPLYPGAAASVEAPAQHAAIAPWRGWSGEQDRFGAQASSIYPPVTLARRRWKDSGVPDRPWSPQVNPFEPSWFPGGGSVGSDGGRAWSDYPGEWGYRGPTTYGGYVGQNPYGGPLMQGATAVMQRNAQQLAAQEAAARADPGGLSGLGRAPRGRGRAVGRPAAPPGPAPQGILGWLRAFLKPFSLSSAEPVPVPTPWSGAGYQAAVQAFGFNDAQFTARDVYRGYSAQGLGSYYTPGPRPNEWVGDPAYAQGPVPPGGMYGLGGLGGPVEDATKSTAVILGVGAVAIVGAALLVRRYGNRRKR